ncbi:trypsin-like peptidase domain-containing protein, partial [Streptomyces rochei]|uniref:trypsin-like peptidase domain-containing protein n=1 Tax=Streptomyces rochei TaxID=1928 RepID=UPI003A598DB7
TVVLLVEATVSLPVSSWMPKAVPPPTAAATMATAARRATGPRVIITGDGEIITNNHVVSGASSVKVTTSDGKQYTADVVGTDSSKDLA